MQYKDALHFLSEYKIDLSQSVGFQDALTSAMHLNKIARFEWEYGRFIFFNFSALDGTFVDRLGKPYLFKLDDCLSNDWFVLGSTLWNP